MSFILLEHHHEARSTIIYKNHVFYFGYVVDINNDEQVNELLSDDIFGLPCDKWQEVLDAIKADEPKLNPVDVLFESGSLSGRSDLVDELAMFAQLYNKNVEIDPNMRQIIIDSYSPQWASEYCVDVEDHPEVRQIIIDSEDAKWAYYYLYGKPDCLDSIKKQMRQIILDDKDEENLYWVYEYCRDIEDDEDMRQKLIDSNDKELLELYQKTVNSDIDINA